MLASAYLLQGMIQYDFKYFIKNIVLKILLITLISFIIPLVLCVFINESWIRLIIVSIVSVLYIIPIIYFWGLDASEKLFIRDIVRNNT